MVDKCERNFLNYTRDTSAPSASVQVKCRSEKSVTILVTPMQQWQVIVLINNQRNDSEIINYALIEPNQNHSVLYTPLGNYTIWKTVLNNNGSPMFWRRDQHIQPWSEIQTNLKQKVYEVHIKFLTNEYVKGTKLINALFSWNTTDAFDSCFDIINHCNKKNQGDYYHNKIEAFYDKAAIIKDLPLDDTCTFHLTGLYGNTSLSYQTLSCYDLSGCRPSPEVVQHLEAEAESTGAGRWAVRVTWSRQKHPPQWYNVTLDAEDVHNAVVPGNVTEVQFEGVRGAGLYAVFVASQLDDSVAFTSHQNIFPPVVAAEAGERRLVELVWLLGLLSAAALGCSLVCWRRRLNAKRRNVYFASVLEKMAGEADTDGESPESGSEDQWEIRPERIVLHEIIGEGAFGVVRRGNLAPTNKDVAVKMLKDFPSVEEIRSFRSEMELMKSVGAHPHVVSLVGCCSGRRPLILAEYCSRGDLLTFLRCSWDVMLSRRNAKYYNNNNKEMDYRIDAEKSRSKETKIVVNRLYDLEDVCDTELTLLDLLSFCRQIAMGMEFLASNRVVHRDLAARNVLVTADRTLKIADFGLSRDVYQENQYKQKGNGKMPVKWMALESLTHRVYTTQSDVWSFGVVMWEVVTVGGAPYAGVSAARLPRLLAAGYRMPRPHNCSPQLYELMLSCWSTRPRSRPTFAELHAALDALLCARADHYLTLGPDHGPPHSPRPPRRHCVRAFTRGNFMWGRSKSYERPQATSNHYTVQPALAARDAADGRVP